MTDRLKGLTVTLEPNIREDDAQAIIDAIKMIKGVSDVATHVADIHHHMAVTTARQEMLTELYTVCKAFNNGKKIKIVDES